MALLTQAQLDQVAASVADVEKNTDAELVVVLAKQADSYTYFPLLLASLIALALPLALKLTPFWLTADELLATQWISFIVLALLFRVPPIMMALVPKSVKHWRASNLARRQFLENNLHHTKGETGVLVFLAEAEHYVEIIADRGISQQVNDREWQMIVDNLIARIRQRETMDGLLSCINSCGELLADYAPATEEKNELPNHLVVLN